MGKPWFLLQRAIGLLGGRQVAGLKRLSQLLKQLVDPIFLTSAVMVMVMVMVEVRSLILGVLDGCVVLLCCRDIAGLQILAELLELLPKLLHPVLNALNAVILQAAAGNA